MQKGDILIGVRFEGTGAYTSFKGKLFVVDRDNHPGVYVKPYGGWWDPLKLNEGIHVDLDGCMTFFKDRFRVDTFLTAANKIAKEEKIKCLTKVKRNHRSGH